MKRLLQVACLLVGIGMPALSNRLLVVTTPQTSGGLGYGYQGSRWDEMTDLLQDAFGDSNITVAETATGLDAYDAIWLDQRWINGSLTAGEQAELAAFANSGRRMVMIGENYRKWAAWNNQILGIVGGTSGGNSEPLSYEFATPAMAHQLTAGVTSTALMFDGFALGGTSLFDRPVATLWGTSSNTLTWLSVNMQSDDYIDLSGNREFSSNVAQWLSTGPVKSLQHSPEPSTYALFGAALAVVAMLKRHARRTSLF